MCYLQTCIAHREKDFKKIHRMKNKLFIFNLVEDIYFFCFCTETNYLKKTQAPPPQKKKIKWSVARVKIQGSL